MNNLFPQRNVIFMKKNTSYPRSYILCPYKKSNLITSKKESEVILLRLLPQINHSNAMINVCRFTLGFVKEYVIRLYIYHIPDIRNYSTVKGGFLD